MDEVEENVFLLRRMIVTDHLIVIVIFKIQSWIETLTSNFQAILLNKNGMNVIFKPHTRLKQLNHKIF